jgi:putative ABC transport system substrate-binding protein
MKRRTFLGYGGAALMPLFPGIANARTKTLRVGIFSIGPRDAGYLAAFEKRLRELNYIEGRNLAVEFVRVAGPDGFDEAAKELVRRAVDVILASGPVASLLAATRATQTIPIVVLAVDFDPLTLAGVGSLSRPEGNVTGIFFQQTELATKRLELTKGILSPVRSLAAFWDDFSKPQWEKLNQAASALNLQVFGIKLDGPRYGYEAALQTVPEACRGAVFVLASPIFFYDRVRLADFAMRNRMISAFAFREFVDAGGLFSYGPNLVSLSRRAAEYVDMIAKGARTTDLPIEQPTKFELVVNLRTSRSLGVDIPEDLLLQADETIE